MGCGRRAVRSAIVLEAATQGACVQEDGTPEVLRRRPRHHMESEHQLTARQRARLADLSLLLDKVLSTKNLTKQKELLRRGLLSQLQFCAVNNYGTGYKSALLKILRVVEALPLYAVDVHARRSAHGSFGDVLVDLAGSAADRGVRERARSLLQRFPPPGGAPPPAHRGGAAAEGRRSSHRGAGDRSSAPGALDSTRSVPHSKDAGARPAAAAAPPPLRLGPPPPAARESTLVRQPSAVSARQATDSTHSPPDSYRAASKRGGTSRTPEHGGVPLGHAAHQPARGPVQLATGTVTQAADGELFTTTRPWWAVSAARAGHEAAAHRLAAAAAASACGAAVLGVEADVAQGLQLGLYRACEFQPRRSHRQ